MHEPVRNAIAQTKLYTDGHRYCLIHLAASVITPAAAILAACGEAFSALIIDKDEVTLVLREEHLEVFAHRLPAHTAQCGYHLLTFDLPLELTMVGFLSAISAALAAADVPIMAFSAFERDHLLIPGSHLERARRALDELQSQARAENAAGNNPPP